MRRVFVGLNALCVSLVTTLLVACGGGSQPLVASRGAMAQSFEVAAHASRVSVSHAAAPQLKEYYLPNRKIDYPLTLAFDTQGDLWFNAFLSPYIGERAPGGAVTAHKLPHKNNACPPEYADEFALGPDHNVWFTDLCGQTVGTVKPDGKILQKDPFSGVAYTAGISTMSGHLWVVITYGYLVELSTNWKLIEVISLYGSSCGPGAVTVGYAKTLWITNSGNCPEITRVTPDGTVTDFPVQAKDGVWAIARGPDGNMWFTAADGPKINAWVGKITPNGQITKYPIADQAWGIAMGPDGNWWITEPYHGHIISMNLQGQVVNDIKLPHALNSSQPRFEMGEIVQGPDGNMWFGEGLRSKIGELVFSHE